MTSLQKGNVIIGATKATLNGTAAEIIMGGSGDQSFTGEIIGAGAEQGVIDNANTDGIVTFQTNIGATELKEVELDATSKTVFKGFVKTALADWDGHVTLEENGNVADSLVTTATTTIKIEETIVNLVRETMIQGYEQWEKAVYETGDGHYRVYVGLKMGIGDANRLAKYIAQNATATIDIDTLAKNAIDSVLTTPKVIITKPDGIATIETVETQ